MGVNEVHTESKSCGDSSRKRKKKKILKVKMKKLTLLLHPGFHLTLLILISSKNGSMAILNELVMFSLLYTSHHAVFPMYFKLWECDISDLMAL